MLEGRKYDRRADLFALGVCLFIMIVGTPPFVEALRSDPFYHPLVKKNHKEFWGKHTGFSRELKKDADLRDLLQRMMAYDPKDRLSVKQILAHPWIQKGVC